LYSTSVFSNGGWMAGGIGIGTSYYRKHRHVFAWSFGTQFSRIGFAVRHLHTDFVELRVHIIHMSYVIISQTDALTVLFANDKSTAVACERGITFHWDINASAVLAGGVKALFEVRIVGVIAAVSLADLESRHLVTFGLRGTGSAIHAGC